MDTDDMTPVAESKDFAGAPTNSSSSSSSCSPRTSPGDDGGGQIRSRAHLAVPQKDSPVSPETDMSASYHEIFDTQMVGISAENEAENEADDGEKDIDDRLAPLLCCDNNTESTTEYLTSKLVEDSLRWQNERGEGENVSPRRRPNVLADDMRQKLAINRPAAPSIDPNAIETIERHSRYLATCVDSMVENLAGVLQGASALTVDTLEIYRDGVCKTSDEVDNNIKSMYQLMAKVEELNKSMAPAYKIGEEVKEVKKLLDVFESVASSGK